MNTETDKNSKRKREHLEIVLKDDVSFKEVTTGLESYRFIHHALPEVDLAATDTSTSLFGKKLRFPVVISSMVGGIEAARHINRNLAAAAQRLGVAMGMGSERCAIDDPRTASTYQVRHVAPDILLLANLGAIQLNNGYGVEECRRAVEIISADALVLHLNPLQEALQAGGNTNFAGLLKKIEQVCRELKVPVIVKEVGWGISEEVARQLAAAGVAGIDTAGAGGTSWSEVERHRTPTPAVEKVAASFAGWGIPTAESIQVVKAAAPGLPLIASGGIRSGIDIAKALALGADAAGIAAPLLRPATESVETVIEALSEIIEEMKIAMFCTGILDIASLKNTPRLVRK